MTTAAALWVQGARPRTLAAAVAPVAAGTGAAAASGTPPLRLALLCLVVAIALQVGVNYANDYSDGIRGTDDARRVGPLRLVGSGSVSPGAVRTAALLAFSVAGLAGLVAVLASRQWWLLAVGAVSVAAAWAYTGGRRPYGYAGLGEVAVFVFFGLVAVLGTVLVLGAPVGVTAVAAAVGVGSLACAILVVNNLRDIGTDAAVGKRTLAVRIGEARTRVLYAVLLGAAGLGVALAAVGARDPWPLLGLVAAPLAVRPLLLVLGGARERALMSVLGATGRLELAYGLLLGVGLAFSG